MANSTISPFSPGLLWSWNLDAYGFRAVISIQPENGTCGDPNPALLFAGLRLADFHGLLVRAEPDSGTFDLYDLDAGLDEGRGARFLDQTFNSRAAAAVWVAPFAQFVYRIDVLARTLQRWSTGTTPTGLAVMPDGTVMMPRAPQAAGEPAFVSQLNPVSGEYRTWKLPAEMLPFSGVASPDGSVYFAARRMSSIARLEPLTGLYSEWLLAPEILNPQIVSRDRLGGIWFGDVTAFDRIGRLNPDRSLTVYRKQGIIPFAVRPVDAERLGSVVAGADLRLAVDVLANDHGEQFAVRETTTTLEASVVFLEPELIDVPFTRVSIPGEVTTVFPEDPAALYRYRTPVVAPLDLTEVGGSIFVTAGTFDERSGPSRLFRLVIPDLLGAGPCAHV